MKEDLKNLYESRLPLLSNLDNEARFIVDTFLKKSKVKIHSVQSRIKSLYSLSEKATAAELGNPQQVFEEINDVVGLRIICLFISDIDELKTLVRDHFDVLNEDNKVTNSEISSFGYFSVHFTCKIKKTFTGPRYDLIKDLLFEIQVRTISMDAWANISHYLDYKSETEVPTELKKDFFALSGLFYVADTHFEMFFKNKKEQAKIAQHEIETNLDVELNFETLQAYLNDKFPKREAAARAMISILTQELTAFGIKSIEQLDTYLGKAFIKKPEAQRVKSLNRVGIVRSTLSDSLPNYKQHVTDFLARNNRIK